MEPTHDPYRPAEAPERPETSHPHQTDTLKVSIRRVRTTYVQDQFSVCGQHPTAASNNMRRVRAWPQRVALRGEGAHDDSQDSRTALPARVTNSQPRSIRKIHQPSSGALLVGPMVRQTIPLRNPVSFSHQPPSSLPSSPFPSCERALHARLDRGLRGGAQRHAAHHDAPCGRAPLLAGDEDGDAYRSDDSQRASTYAQRRRQMNKGSGGAQGPN